LAGLDKGLAQFEVYKSDKMRHNWDSLFHEDSHLFMKEESKRTTPSARGHHILNVPTPLFFQLGLGVDTSA